MRAEEGLNPVCPRRYLTESEVCQRRTRAFRLMQARTPALQEKAAPLTSLGAGFLLLFWSL
jgi:hypothetical protein